MVIDMRTYLSMMVVLFVGITAADAFGVPTKYGFIQRQMDEGHKLWEAWYVVDHAKGIEILAGEISYNDVDNGWSGHSNDVYGSYFHEVDWSLNTDELNLEHTSGVKRPGFRANLNIMGAEIRPKFSPTSPHDIDIGTVRYGEILAGDANFDQQFNSNDLVQVFQRGQYDRFQEAAQWMDGDWNYDSQFNSSDLVLAMQTGKYEQPAAVAVPEPDSRMLLGIAGAGALFILLRTHRTTALANAPSNISIRSS